MKKYFLGLLAFSFAVMAVAFTTKSTLIKFKYVPPTSGDYSQTSVQTLTNWVADASISCTSNDQVPCKIEVDNTHTVNNAGAQLDANEVTIEATLYSSGRFYVSGGDFVESIINKQVP